MTPPMRVALRHASVRSALVLVAGGPVWVGWLGSADEAPLRLRMLGLAAAVVAAFAWDDRVHALTASTPVGLPAVRRGRALVVLVLLALAFALGCLAVPSGAPIGAVALQTAGLTALLLAVVGWFGRDGDPVLALAMPALAVTLLVLTRLPERVALLHADPAGAQWPAERNRWLVLLAMSTAVALWLSRDPASRHLGRHPFPSHT